VQLFPAKKASGNNVSKAQGALGDVGVDASLQATQPSFWSKVMIRKPELIEGSAKHNSGDCLPCGFHFKGKCKEGNACQYCHLCTKGDVRRRNKENLKKKEADAAVDALKTSWATI